MKKMLDERTTYYNDGKSHISFTLMIFQSVEFGIQRMYICRSMHTDYEKISLQRVLLSLMEY